MLSSFPDVVIRNQHVGHCISNQIPMLRLVVAAEKLNSRVNFRYHANIYRHLPIKRNPDWVQKNCRILNGFTAISLWVMDLTQKVKWAEREDELQLCPTFLRDLAVRP